MSAVEWVELLKWIRPLTDTKESILPVITSPVVAVATVAFVIKLNTTSP